VTRKRRRLYGVLLGMSALGVAAALALTAFQDNLVFFFSPSDLESKQISPDRNVRLGGLVEANSVKRLTDGVTVEFRITDGPRAVPVHYTGVLPDLFREGQGVVVEGRLVDGVFRAREVLAKHDETYMPREVADALKKAGHWQEGKKP